jgi:FkbM family methyltransferase
MVTTSGIPVAHACEVGVFEPRTSNVSGWIESGTRTTLVECDPLIVAQLQQRWGALDHVTIHDVAVADEEGELTLYRVGASTFGANIERSPALVNDRYVPKDEHAFTVRCTTFDRIDDGTIDVLSIDIEGGEWNVLKHLRSRPAVISLETHGKHYTNPHMADIDAWMTEHNYGAWYRDGSDTVYRRGWTGPVEDRSPALTAFQRMKRWWRDR